MANKLAIVKNVRTLHPLQTQKKNCRQPPGCLAAWLLEEMQPSKLLNDHA